MFKVNIGVGQGSVLSPILSALYLPPFLYILENYLKNLNIPVSIILFVDNGLFISQDKSLVSSSSCPFCSYNVMTKLLDKFGLIIKHSKTKFFHFNRLHSLFDLSPLDLSSIRGPILIPKNSWKYLGFIFDGSSPSTNISTTTTTGLYPQSSVWEFWITHYTALSWHKNTFSTNAIFSPLLCTVFNYSSTTMLLFHTLWKFWIKYREELLFRY